MKSESRKPCQLSISHTSRHRSMLMVLVVIMVLTAGCSDNQKRKAAQKFVLQGAGTCADLTAQYKELTQQSQKTHDLFIWQLTYGSPPVMEKTLYFFDPTDIKDVPLLVHMLKNPLDPALHLVREHLPTAGPLLDAADPTGGASPIELKKALAKDLTALVQTRVLYQSQAVLDFTGQQQKDAEEKRKALQDVVDGIKEELLKANPQQQVVLKPQLAAALAALAPETNRAARFELVNNEVIEALANTFQPDVEPAIALDDTAKAAEAAKITAARKQFLTDLRGQRPPQNKSAGAPRTRMVDLPSPIKERVNRLLLANLLRDGIVAMLDEERHLQEEAINSRVELAQGLTDVFTAVGDLINFDARGKTITAAEDVQKQIEAVNHHPLHLGHGIPANIFTRAFGDFARDVQVRNFYKDLPKINLAVQDITDLYGAEEDEYFAISKIYYVQSYNTVKALIDTKEDLDTRSALQPELDPYTFHLISHPAATDQAVSHAKAQAYFFRQSHIKGANSAVNAMEKKLKALVKIGHDLTDGPPKNQAPATSEDPAPAN